MRKDRDGGGLIVILHNIRSSYNVGSIFRTADAMGASKIYLGGYTPNPGKDSKVRKTALGAEGFVPWETVWHTHKLIDSLKQQGVSIVALEQSEKSISLEKFMPTFPMALLLGNEVKGLSKKMLEKVDEVVEIPMAGKKESMNVAVVFGIAAFQVKLKAESYKVKRKERE